MHSSFIWLNLRKYLLQKFYWKASFIDFCALSFHLFIGFIWTNTDNGSESRSVRHRANGHASIFESKNERKSATTLFLLEPSSLLLLCSALFLSLSSVLTFFPLFPACLFLKRGALRAESLLLVFRDDVTRGRRASRDKRFNLLSR